MSNPSEVKEKLNKINVIFNKLEMLNIPRKLISYWMRKKIFNGKSLLQIVMDGNDPDPYIENIILLYKKGNNHDLYTD